MNLEKLEVGMEIKNYKILCNNLNEEVKGGKSKVLQLDNWKRYFDWDKVGNAFIIVDIYDEPLPKEDSRSKGNRNVYAKYIEVLLLDLLSKQNNYTLICSRNWLLMHLGIVNYKYTHLVQRQIIKKKGEFKEEDLNDWFNHAWQKTDQILFSALNNLKKRCLLDYSQELLITKLDENGKEYSFLANDEEKAYFLAAKRKTLVKLTAIHKNDKYPKIFDSLRDIYPNYYDEFYKVLSDIVLDKYGWINTYTQYKLIYNQEYLIDAIPTTELQLQRLELNQKVVDAMHNDAETKSENILTKFKEEYALLCETWFGTPPYEYCKSYKYLKANDYIEIQDKISEIFIRIDEKTEKVVTSYAYKEKDSL